MGLVDAGQQHDVGGRVAGGKAPPAVGRRAHRALAPELADQARRLGPAQAAELLQETPHQALLGAAQLGVVVPAQHGLEQRVLRSPAGSCELDILTALQKRPDLLQAQRFGLLHDDSHRPQLAPSEARLPAQPTPLCSSCIGMASGFRLVLYWKRRSAGSSWNCEDNDWAVPKVRDAIRLVGQDGWSLVRTRGSHRVSTGIRTSREP